jgi:hypothetical protein
MRKYTERFLLKLDKPLRDQIRQAAETAEMNETEFIRRSMKVILAGTVDVSGRVIYLTDSFHKFVDKEKKIIRKLGDVTEFLLPQVANKDISQQVIAESVTLTVLEVEAVRKELNADTVSCPVFINTNKPYLTGIVTLLKALGYSVYQSVVTELADRVYFHNHIKL